MKVTVKFFASVREMMGTRAETLELNEGTTVAELWQMYVARQPRLATMSLSYAVNRTYSPPERVLVEGDEVALIPPVSGG